MRYKIEALIQTDEHLFRMYLDGPKFHSALDKILITLRNKVKYGDEQGSWQEAYTTVLEILNDANIDVYEY